MKFYSNKLHEYALKLLLEVLKKGTLVFMEYYTNTPQSFPSLAWNQIFIVKSLLMQFSLLNF